MDNELLDKAVQYTPAEKRAFIDHRQGFGSVQRGANGWGCTGGYYYRLRQKSLMAKKEEADLRERIE